MRELRREHTLAATALARVPLEQCPLSVAVVGHDQELPVGVDDVERHDLVALVEADADHAPGRPPHCTHDGLGEADRHAVAGDLDQLVAPRRGPHLDQLVVGPDVEGDDPVLARGVVGAEQAPLDDALAGGHDQVLVRLEVAGVDDRRHLLFGRERQEVADRDAARRAVHLGDLVGAQPVHLAPRREHQHEGMVGRRQHLVDDVTFLGPGPDDALAAPALRPVGGGLDPLHVARPCDRDDHVLVGDEIFDGELAGVGCDHRAARVGELLADGEHLLLDDRQEFGLRAEDLLEGGDRLAQLLGLRAQLVALQRGKAAQLHVEHVAGLDLREGEAAHQLDLGDVGGGGRPDQRDDLVDVVDRQQQPLDDVQTLLGLAEAELGPAPHHLALVADEDLDELLEREHPRHAVDQRELDDPERVLELRVLVEVVEHHLRHDAAPELEHDARSQPVGLVAAP